MLIIIMIERSKRPGQQRKFNSSFFVFIIFVDAVAGAVIFQSSQDLKFLSLSKIRNANPLGLIFCIILGTPFRPLFIVKL